METLDLLDERKPVTKTILQLAWPTITEQILLTCVNYIDTAMVGSLGAIATAAISINAATIFLVNGLLTSLAVGYSVIVAKNIGSENYKRSLSIKGCPFDNAVSESTYKIIKTEFAYDRKFVSQEELDLELFDYVNWYNNKRLHGTLGYMSPKEFREVSLTKLSK